jgi:DNA-binding response OmpR family regulator
VKLRLIDDDQALYVTLERALQPDVVLLDLTLHGRDGLQILQQARDEDLATPVLIITARGTVDDQVLALAPRELTFLKALLAQPNQAVSKERLFELVFPGQQEVQFEAIEVVA